MALGILFNFFRASVSLWEHGTRTLGWGDKWESMPNVSSSPSLSCWHLTLARASQVSGIRQGPIMTFMGSFCFLSKHIKNSVFWLHWYKYEYNPSWIYYHVFIIIPFLLILKKLKYFCRSLKVWRALELCLMDQSALVLGHEPFPQAWVSSFFLNPWVPLQSRWFTIVKSQLRHFLPKVFIGSVRVCVAHNIGVPAVVAVYLHFRM